MANTDLLSSSFYIIAVLLLVYSISLFEPAKEAVTKLHIWWIGYGSKKPQESSHLTQNISAGSAASVVTEKESTYSPSWWYGDHIFQLEQRAIFSQKWIYATHRSRFSKPGDYITLNVARFSFFLILGKDEVLRGFHNVCRHRAYEVTRKEHGSSTVLGCRYHGWSYDTKGQLTKAPEFENVPGFNKKQNGLWEIQVDVSTLGLVFVNLDARGSIDLRVTSGMETAAKDWNMPKSRKVADWRYEGDFNWKAAIISGLPESHNRIAHILENIPDQGQDGFLRLLGILSKEKRQFCLQVDLITTITVCPIKATWLVIRAAPQSATKTILEYELYSWASNLQPLLPELSTKNLKDASIVDIDDSQALQKAAIKGNLCLDDAQIQWQNSVRQLLLTHRKLELSSGTEIHPAARQVSLSGQGQEDVKLCRALEKEASIADACKEAQTDCPSKNSTLDW